MSTQNIRAGKAALELGVKDQLTAQLRATLDAAGSKLRSFGTAATAAGAAMGAAGAAMAAPLAGAVARYFNYADAIDLAAQKTGLATGAVAELGYAALRSGTNSEAFQKSIIKMSQNLSKLNEGNKSTVAAFEALGLSQKELAGMAPDEQFTALGEAISRISNPADRAATAMELFGKSGAELLPMFLQGAAGIEALRDEAREMGVSLSEESRAVAARFGDTMDKVKTAIDMAVVRLGEALVPAIQELLDTVLPYITAAGKWIAEHKQLAVVAAALAAGLAAGGAALTAIGLAASAAGTALSGLAAVVGAIGGLPVILAASAAALVAFVPEVRAAFTGLGRLAAQVWSYIDTVTGGYLSNMSGAVGDFISGAVELFGNLWDDATTAWQGISDALAAGDLGLAAEVAMSSLRLAFQRGINAVYTPWLEFKTGLISTWDNVVTTIRTAWNNVTTWIAEKLINVWALISRTLGLGDIDAEATIRTLREDQGRKRDSLADAQAARDQARIREMTQAQAAAEQRLAQLIAQRDEAAGRAATAGNAAREEKRRKAEEERHRKFVPDEDLFDTDATATAGNAAREEKRRKAEEERHRKFVPDEDLFDTDATATAPKAKAAGTFSAIAAAFLGGPESYQKKTADAAEATRKHTAEIAQNTRRQAAWG
jgi:hypothetical protein